MVMSVRGKSSVTIKRLLKSGLCSSKILPCHQHDANVHRYLNHAPYALARPHRILQHSPCTLLIKVMERQAKCPEMPLFTDSARRSSSIYWVRDGAEGSRLRSG
jgi:hypothetical protein